MADPEPLLCPECGWTGTNTELDRVEGDHRCPVCAETIEFVD